MTHARKQSSPREPSASTWLADLPSSVVVFLVALPLCIGIAVACGVPPERGLVTGIVGGIVVGSIAGAPLLVSGPAASLIVPVFEIVSQHGIAMLGPVVMLAGVWQAIAGRLRLGQWFRAVAPAVIRGMLIGIGVLIFASQLHVAIDADPSSSFVDNVLTLPGKLAGMLSRGMAGLAPALVGAATIAMLIGWNALRPARLQLVPGHLVSLLVVTSVTVALGTGTRVLDISPSFFDGLEPVSVTSLGVLLDASLVGRSLVFAFVASAATLLTAAAIDQRQTHSQADFDRELQAQGIGNLTTGLLGGLPMTGVIVRSSVNVDAGARTRASTMLHGLWILVFVVAAPEVLELIPRASLGAILVYTGYKLVDVGALRELYGRGRSELVICLITLLGVVFLDLFVGIVAGLVAAVAKLVHTFTSLQVRSEPSRDSNVHHLHLAGSATFLRLPYLAQVLDGVPTDRELHVHIDHLDHIDHACLELLSSWNQRRRKNDAPGMVVEWDELTDRYREALTGARPVAPRSMLHLVWGEWKRVHRAAAAAPALAERWLEPSRVHVGLRAQELRDVVVAASQLLAPHAGQPADRLVAALLQRPEGHVGLGEGVSLPHAPIEDLQEPMVALVTTASPLLVDGDQADVFFVLLAPEHDHHAHLRALAHVGRLCHHAGLLDRLRAATHADEVVAAVSTAERAFSRADEPGDAGPERLLAVIEVDEHDPARIAELVAQGFGEPLRLSPGDEAFRALRAVVRGRSEHPLLVIPVEAREVNVLQALLREQTHLEPGALVQLHLLRSEQPLEPLGGGAHAR
ncbi:SulP family inorganic anion transporter [Paraliomyxa miuraensis]|uniref:SulP family inorganic anion transporter n=1 Tax=Paraliomyxa miuraensis TaxID=376150 RepID=UPI00225B41BE|nr:SulP family inorganic anion transporter [Paraliomyxa miuraensis]MCX4241420.1 SulP family inorganic anion transporter [Paraliomyxa miuraensis]